ncbi:TolC family protein [Candidatus Kapaibacterium sp.]
MYKLVFVLFLCWSTSYSLSYDSLIAQILHNNKDIKAYSQYLAGVSIESKFNNLPPDPQVNYGIMSGSGFTSGGKHELIVMQPFEFPTVYSIKSDIASGQNLVNKFKLMEYKRDIALIAGNLIVNYLFQKKLIANYELRMSNYENIFRTIEQRFNKSEISILEYNKSKSSLAFIRSKLNLANIELDYIKSAIINLNGGINPEIDTNDNPIVKLDSDRDSLINELQKLDFNNQLYDNEKELYENKLSLTKIGWLPNFSLGYRFEREPGIDFSGAQINFSIPIFENQHKTSKAQSDLSYIELRQQAYKTNFINNKKRLFDKLKLLESNISEQKEIINNNQFELLQKALNLSQINLTEFYYENTIYYDIEDSILQIEKEFHQCYNEFMIENLLYNINNRK